ncbi:MAG: response regulator, partial [Leptospiraceae bacterium]|nr:response regulator [Leptospiraceae bacterium]
MNELENRNLLVLDDEEEILKALRRQFRKSYQIFDASTPKDAYIIMRENPIQVIISDQRMPEMNGTEFLSSVKSEFPDAIRLILTGYADIKAVIDAINAGNVFRYVTKPWDPVELDTIVNEAFEKYELTIRNRKLVEDLKTANELLEQRVKERTEELLKLNTTKDKF